MPDTSAYPALILAAGLSSRMGRDKASLPWLGGQSLLEWTVSTLRQADWQPVIVLGPHNFPYWQQRLSGVPLVLNPEPSRGKTSSIAVGAVAVKDRPGALLLAGVDQPRPASVYQRLREFGESESIVVPWDGTHRDHPILIGSNWRNRLLALDEQTEGLRGLMEQCDESLVRCPFPGEWLRWDCNTPEAYDAALAWFQG